MPIMLHKLNNYIFIIILLAIASKSAVLNLGSMDPFGSMDGFQGVHELGTQCKY